MITTIIPTYKRPKLLKRALTSVLNQTYPHFQVHVYDNASGDETSDVVCEFMRQDARVKYHCHPQNIGMMANYEFAMAQVKTPYFSLLSDDDLVLPWFFEVALKGFEASPNAAFSAASTIIMSEQGDVIRVPLDAWPREGQFDAPQGVLEMISKYPVPVCILFRQKVIEEVPIDQTNPLTWDCDFLLQIAARHSIFICKQPCGIFLHHDHSYSNAQDFEKWEHSLKCMSKRLGSLDHFSTNVKNLAFEYISNDLKGSNRAFVLHSLFGRKFREAYDYATRYRKNYGLNFSLLILLIASKICYYFPPIIYLFFFIRKIKRIRRNGSQRYCKRYAKWIIDRAPPGNG